MSSYILTCCMLYALHVSMEPGRAVWWQAWCPVIYNRGSSLFSSHLAQQNISDIRPNIREQATTRLFSSASKCSIRRFVITEKAPTRAFSWLKAATTAFTFKTLLRHYANNQEKALVGAFSVITNLRMDLFEALLHTLTRPRLHTTALETPSKAELQSSKLPQTGGHQTQGEKLHLTKFIFFNF